MKCSKIVFALCCVMVLPLHAGLTNAEPGNPFRVIVASNVFRLRPPEPEPESKPIPQRLPPLAEVMLTGIHTVFGPPQVLLEIKETVDGKLVSSRPILREGEGAGPIHVLAIDVEKSLVLIRNGAVETNLVFDPLAQTTAPAVAVAVPLPTLHMRLPPAHGG